MDEYVQYLTATTYPCHLSNAERLQGLTNLHFDHASWLLYYCRQILSGSPDFSLTGMALSRVELQLLDLDGEELLAKLLAGAVDCPWVKGTRDFDYIGTDGCEHSSAPGEDIDATQLVRIRLRADITAFPHHKFLSALRVLCDKLKCRYEDFLLPHYRLPCQDPIRMAQSLLNRECDPYLVASELDVWRIRMNERVQILLDSCKKSNGENPEALLPMDEVLALFWPQNVMTLDRDDPRIQRHVKRSVIAEMAGRSLHTIQVWERSGIAASGLEWPKPTRSATGHLMYFLPEYLEALKQLIPYSRDSKRDRQLRDEIIGQKFTE